MDFAGKRIHFVGCAGVSMSGLMKLVQSAGATVSGSDTSLGGHHARNITKDIDLVVINGAIADNNPELRRAQKLGLHIMGREELLAEIESGYENRIAVAGTHGKSTTTAMIAAIFTAAGFNPTVHNGVPAVRGATGRGAPLERPQNLIIGGKKYFITEACEFKRSFLKLNPTVAVITNIDFDHADCYRDLDDVKAAFKEFAAKAGTVITTPSAVPPATTPSTLARVHPSKEGSFCELIHQITLPLTHQTTVVHKCVHTLKVFAVQLFAVRCKNFDAVVIFRIVACGNHKPHIAAKFPRQKRKRGCRHNTRICNIDPVIAKHRVKKRNRHSTTLARVPAYYDFSCAVFYRRVCDFHDKVGIKKLADHAAHPVRSKIFHKLVYADPETYCDCLTGGKQRYSVLNFVVGN